MAGIPEAAGHSTCTHLRRPARIVVLPGVFSPPSDAHLLADVVSEHAADCDVLDVCTGSGVVALAAALAGARSVTAVDTSRLALLNARSR